MTLTLEIPSFKKDVCAPCQLRAIQGTPASGTDVVGFNASMISTFKNPHLLRILAASVFLLGNSGMAAVITVCCMPEAEKVSCELDECTPHEKQSGMRMPLSFSAPDVSCTSTAIIGGNLVDDSILSSDAAKEVTPLKYVGILASTTDLSTARSFSANCSSDSPPAENSPPLFLLNASFLI